MTIHTNISEINENQWLRLLKKSSTATFFQTPECFHFYSGLSFLKPFVFGVSENDKLMGIMCGYIISSGNPLQKYFSRRAIVPGGLLLDPNISNDDFKLLLNTAKSILRKEVIYVELHNYKDYNEYRLTFKAEKFEYLPYLNFNIPTFDEETSFGRLNDNLQKQLTLSKEAGVYWEETKNKDDIAAFYAKLKRQHKRSPNTIMYPQEFFEKLVNIPNGKLLVVKYRKKVVGGMACVILPGNTIYNWFICNEENRSTGKAVYIDTMIYWSGIEYAAKNKIQRLEFMNIGKPIDDLKIRDYKRKFGGQTVEMGRYRCVCRPLLYITGKFILENIIRKLGRLRYFYSK
ncbi:MAG: GNAT family N-acetyltransferase [Paludibacter sp.]|nr:GNAT family N-acetyltransferase [Paludibacter sp.]